MNVVIDAHAVALLGDDTPAFTLAYLRSSPDCVKLLNTAGRISFMSENGLCALEIGAPADVVGKSWWDLWPEAEQAAIRSRFEQSMRGEICRFQAHCPTAKGTPKDWDVSLSPVINDDGSITSVLAISRDVTPEG